MGVVGCGLGALTSRGLNTAIIHSPAQPQVQFSTPAYISRSQETWKTTLFGFHYGTHVSSQYTGLFSKKSINPSAIQLKLPASSSHFPCLHYETYCQTALLLNLWICYKVCCSESSNTLQRGKSFYLYWFNIWVAYLTQGVDEVSKRCRAYLRYGFLNPGSQWTVTHRSSVSLRLLRTFWINNALDWRVAASVTSAFRSILSRVGFSIAEIKMVNFVYTVSHDKFTALWSWDQS